MEEPEAAEAGDEGEEGLVGEGDRLEGGGEELKWMGGEGNDQGLGQQQDFFLPLFPIVTDQEQVQEAVRDAVGEVLDGRVRPE